MNLFFKIFAFIFALSNNLAHELFHLTKDIPCQTTGGSPELTSSRDAGLFDTTGEGHFIFTMSNNPAATLAKHSSKSANLTVAANRQQTINHLLNEYFDFNGAAAPTDILCHLITTTATDTSLCPAFKQDVVFEATRLIKLISQLNELRTEEPSTFMFKGKEVGDA